jgi:hypothetical protein
MKKVLLAVAFVFGALQFSNAQISYGVKAGMNFDANSEASKYITMPEGFSIESNTSNGGFHAGAWLRVKIPLVGLYVRPELIYTDLTSQYSLVTPLAELTGDTKIEYNLTKVDVPVLLGLKFLKFGNVFLGPNLQYTTKSESKFISSSPLVDDALSNDSIDEKISFGLIVGAGLEFWKLGLDVRFETGFVNPESTDLSSITTPEDLKPIVDALTGQKPNQVIVGLSYKF